MNESTVTSCYFAVGHARFSELQRIFIDYQTYKERTYVNFILST